ncbi:MAG TPA: cysteine peptidase family C39 domain-containing protein [Candidatus Methanoperedens sp.]|nr:cysteine peptidase family C39 domain-containing protein [Candidatus Methanoperedens sp.]
MANRRKAGWFALAALLLACGCAAAPPPTAEPAPETRVIAGVPFLAQEGETCGPSSLAMLLRFHGIAADPRELADETRIEGLSGALITDLAAAARRRGLAAEVTDLDLAGLRRLIVAGEPAVLLLDLGTWPFTRQHYLIVYGVTAEGVVAHSGSTEALLIPFGRLERQWGKMGRLAIVAARRQ